MIAAISMLQYSTFSLRLVAVLQDSMRKGRVRSRRNRGGYSLDYRCSTPCRQTERYLFADITSYEIASIATSYSEVTAMKSSKIVFMSNSPAIPQG